MGDVLVGPHLAPTSGRKANRHERQQQAGSSRWTTSALGLRLHNADAAVGQPQVVMQWRRTLYGAAAAKSLLRLLRQSDKLGGLRLSGWLTG